MRAVAVAAILISISASVAIAQGGGAGSSSGGATGSGGAALGGLPPSEGPGAKGSAADPGKPAPTASGEHPGLNGLGGAVSLPTTRRANDSYDDGFTACMAMWEGGSTGLSRQEWTRTCNLARIPPPPPGSKR